MGAGCSSVSTSRVYDSARVKPVSQSSARLLNAFGDFSKVPSTRNTSSQPTKDKSQTDLNSTSPPPPPPPLQLEDVTPKEPSTALLPEISPRHRHTVPCNRSPRNPQVNTTNINTPMLQSPSQSTICTLKLIDNSNNNNNADDMPRSNSDETRSKPTLTPPIDKSRRRNSISVLPSFQPKPKVPGNSNSGGDRGKTDPDLVLWISNKLKTKLKLARISKAYDRYK